VYWRRAPQGDFLERKQADLGDLQLAKGSFNVAAFQALLVVDCLLKGIGKCFIVGQHWFEWSNISNAVSKINHTLW
jgi:hypothetical protein